MNITFLILISAAIFIFLTMFSIIDSSRREFSEPYLRTLWILISAVPVLGFIAWFSIGRKKSLPPGSQPDESKPDK